ncbi:MAG: hypothetical protein MRZ39_02160 [Oscillospiraceae bacterium]|nr:hypothetical protein [Oscillospiraceae bacterium]
MTSIEYNDIMEKLLNIVLQKTYNAELEWVTSIGTDGSMKYETTLMPQEITITCVLNILNRQYETYDADMFITINNVCMPFSWFACDMIESSECRAKASELRFVLLENSKKFVLSKLKDLII